MRISNKMVHNQVNSGVNRTRNKLSDLQQHAAAQKRIIKPSDDPLSAAKVLENRNRHSDAIQYIKNIDMAGSFLNYTDQSLEELSEALIHAKELAVSQATDAGTNAQTRQTVALEVEQIFWQAVQIGNRKLGDRFIFGGQQTLEPPFDQRGRFNGDEGKIRIQVGEEAYVAMNMPGSEVFKGEGLSDGGFIGTNDLERINTVEDLKGFLRRQVEDVSLEISLPLRGPASVELETGGSSGGVNIFKVLKDFYASLRADDKRGVQEALPLIDEAISQVILARSSLGSRVTVIERARDSLEREKINSVSDNSQLEDADLVELVSSLNQAENTLKANLQTSGKLIQPSLLDFIR